MPIQLDLQQALLLVVDLQERLLPAIDEKERVLKRSAVLIKAARILGMPIIWSEQYKKGLGNTDPAICAALGAGADCACPLPLEKMAFGCLGDPAILQAVNESGRKQLILIGIETHVCILQTALKGLELGFDVFLAEDAIGSRRASDRQTALCRMRQAGCVPASVEMLIMESLRVAGGDKFKVILPLLKD